MRQGAIVRVYILLVCAFILAPIVVVLGSSLTAAEYTSFPPHGISLRWYVEILRHEEFLDSLWTSTYVAVGASGAALIVGTMAAMASSATGFRGGRR